MSIEKYKIPPVSLFQDVTSSYEDNITYVEFLFGVLKRLNECIADINLNSEFREQSEGLFNEISAKVSQLEIDFNNFKLDVNNNIDSRFKILKSELVILVDNQTAYLKSLLDQQKSELETKIENVALGQITVIDPTTGVKSPLQVVINNISHSADDAITASEYDALQLTATAYSAKNITAYDYDFKGKSLLTA